MFADAIAAAAEAAPQTPVILPTVPGLVLHVDGDYMAYYCAGNDDTTSGDARQNCISRIQRGVARVGAESVVVHNTTSGSQKGERYLIATVKPYQGQRDSDRKPKNYPYLREWLQGYSGDLFRAKNWGTREADDGIGACAHFAATQPVGYAAIMTRDKDLRMLPGIHLEWMNFATTRVLPGDFDVIGEDGKQYGLKWFFIQMLMGDSADFCPGLEQMKSVDAKGNPCFKKVGEATAKKLIDDCADTNEACRQVIDLYRIAYGPEIGDDRFCEQAGLMWMRLSNDAAVADFARHTGHSRINHCFDAAMWAAVERLETRVRLARERITSFGEEDVLSM